MSALKTTFARYFRRREFDSDYFVAFREADELRALLDERGVLTTHVVRF